MPIAFLYIRTMKFMWGLLLVFALLLPSTVLAESFVVLESDSTSFSSTEELREKEDHRLSYIPVPWGIAVGGGTIFSAGLDFAFGDAGLIYETPRPEHAIGPWLSPHRLLWTNRIRMIYDYDNHQYGVFLQPNLRYLFKWDLLSFTLGPEIGWETKTGFEYGASLRVGGAPALLAGNYEIGYLVNTRKFYFTVSFCLSILFFEAMSI